MHPVENLTVGQLRAASARGLASIKRRRATARARLVELQVLIPAAEAQDAALLAAQSALMAAEDRRGELKFNPSDPELLADVAAFELLEQAYFAALAASPAAVLHDERKALHAAMQRNDSIADEHEGKAARDELRRRGLPVAPAAAPLTAPGGRR